MAKITKQEFENYSKYFFSISLRIMNTPEFQNDSEEQKEKGKKLLALTLREIEVGNILALWIACLTSEEILKEDCSVIKSKVKEHIIARGYYNPTSPLTLAEYRERKNKRGWENFRELWKNKEQFDKLLMEMSEENQKFVTRIFESREKVDEIFLAKEDEKMTEEEWEESGFIWEDVLKVCEEAQKKLAEREREREREQTQPFSHYP